MTASAHPSRLRAVVRLLLLVAAIGLTTWGVCLIAFAGTMRGTRLGIPIAFWGVLLGYTAIRTNGHKAGTAETEPSDVTTAPQVPPPASAELVRERDEATRHEYETRLELMLRRELEQVLRTELAGLRSDVTDLRGDVAELRADVLDGRLRMEHVEITRITGANLAALQDDGRIAVRAAADVALAGAGVSSDQGFRREDAAPIRNGYGFDAVPAAVVDVRHPDGVDGIVRQRGAWRDSVRGGVLEPGTSTSGGPIAAAPAPASAVTALAVGAPSPLSAPANPAATIPPAVVATPTPAASPPRPVAWTKPTASTQLVPDPRPEMEAAPLTEPASPEPRPAPADGPGPDVTPGPAASRSTDPFASLPRLSAFRLPNLPAGMSVSKPVPPPTDPDPVESASAPSGTSTPAPAVPANGYVGRRRHAGAEADDEPTETPGRHGSESGSDATPARATGSGGSPRPVAHRR